MQSSSWFSVITISFPQCRPDRSGGGIGIIFGANLGTTTGAWIVAGFGLKVNLSAHALPMLVFGVLLLIFQRHRGLKGLDGSWPAWASCFSAFTMKEGFAGFADHLDLTRHALGGVAGLLLYSLFGALATVIMQSGQSRNPGADHHRAGCGADHRRNALALAIGANVGNDGYCSAGRIERDS